MQFYITLKDNPSQENYLKLLCRKDAILFTKFRCRDRNMPISKSNFNPHCDHDLFKCKPYAMNELGDDFHYIFKCSAFVAARTIC